MSGLLEGDDVMATARALRALGAGIDKHDGGWRVTGVGARGFTSPDGPLDLGNAGTGCRLLMGAVAGYRLSADFIGDASLSGRPMGRVLDPLAQMGVGVTSTDGRLPARLESSGVLSAIDWHSPVASAQIKSCVLLAGLGAQGTTTVLEPHLSRDHTERMLATFGVQVESEETADGWLHTVTGPQSLVAPGEVFQVAGDPSSAMFVAVAGLITPGSAVTVRGVMGNPLRTEGLAALVEWAGGDSGMTLSGDGREEPMADVHVVHAPHRTGRVFRGGDMPNAIDEVPVLAVAGAYAEGETRFEDFADLRVKESDRIAATCAMLEANGVKTQQWDDGFCVHGMGHDGVPGGGVVTTHHDHRIAMAALVLGLNAQQGVGIDDASMIATSYPEFFAHMAGLGADVRRSGAAV